MKNYFLYAACEPERTISFPKHDENNWEKLFNHSNFDFSVINLSQVDIDRPLERTLIIETEAEQQDLEDWLSNWSKNVKKARFFLTLLDINWQNTASISSDLLSHFNAQDDTDY